MSNEELMILLKYGSKENAINFWLDNTAEPHQFREINIVQHWNNSKVPLLKAIK